MALDVVKRREILQISYLASLGVTLQRNLLNALHVSYEKTSKQKTLPNRRNLCWNNSDKSIVADEMSSQILESIIQKCLSDRLPCNSTTSIDEINVTI